jgi:hypothetical protein
MKARERKSALEQRRRNQSEKSDEADQTLQYLVLSGEPAIMYFRRPVAIAVVGGGYTFLSVKYLYGPRGTTAPLLSAQYQRELNGRATASGQLETQLPPRPILRPQVVRGNTRKPTQGGFLSISGLLTSEALTIRPH